MILHPWHEAEYGTEAPAKCWAFIEISRGSRAKYEIDTQTGILKLDRVLQSSVYYPVNYGFIPQTMALDGDPLDILVLSQIDIQPHCLVKAKIIGVMKMIDQGIEDDKIIAVAEKDSSVNYIQSIDQLSPSFERECMHFFETYTYLENKKVSTKHFMGQELAFQIINDSIKLYSEKFPKKGSD